MSLQNSPYTTKFYEDTASYRSAEIILDCIHPQLKSDSVADFGCGQGYRLASAEENGAEELFGFDGDWVDQTQLRSKSINYQITDFSAQLPELNRRFDMAISVEVAEHLPAEKSVAFVELLCRASDVVLFSAAIKHQGGNSHINEQWQSYWIEQFQYQGSECFDVFRPKIWNDDNVLRWYCQNVFLFVNSMSKTIDRTAFLPTQSFPINLVHPLNYDLKIKYYENRIAEYNELLTKPSLGFCMNNLGNYLKSLV